MIPFMVSNYGVFQVLFLVPISEGIGHITMAQPRTNIGTALSTKNEQKQNPHRYKIHTLSCLCLCHLHHSKKTIN